MPTSPQPTQEPQPQPEQKPDETGIFGRTAETIYRDVPLSVAQGLLETVRSFATPLREMNAKEQEALAES